MSIPAVSSYFIDGKKYFYIWLDIEDDVYSFTVNFRKSVFGLDDRKLPRRTHCEFSMVKFYTL